MIPRKASRIRAGSGVTLVELMIAVGILSVGILGFFGAFRYISASLHVSRTRTLATSIAQEKVEILKSLGYYKLQISTASAEIPGLAPLRYDPVSYPPETVAVSGVRFTRYSYVTFAEVHGGVVTAVSYNYPDPGMKQLTVTVAWAEPDGRRKWSLTNLLENPTVSPLDSTLSGAITAAGGAPLAGAVVRAQEDPDYSGVSDAAGAYSFSVRHGSYTVRASSAGYHDAVSPLTAVAAGDTVTVDLTLTEVATGTVSGAAWTNPGLVISQVVANTTTVVGDGSTRAVEYIELFNPTTSAIAIGSNSPPSRSVSLNYWSYAAGRDRSDAAGDYALAYVSTFVAPGRYYLIANATAFYVLGSLRTADAYYGNLASGCRLYDDCIDLDKEGAVELQDPGGATIDLVGWLGNGNAPPTCQGACIPTLATGIGDGNQLVRFSSPAVLSSSIGRAYDSQENSRDFLYPPSLFTGLVYPPFGSADAAQPVVAGRPAVGAEVAATDPRSGSVRISTAYVAAAVGAQPYAPFSLSGVSTGAWGVHIVDASGAYYAFIDSVTVAQGQAAGVPGAATSPAWEVAGVYSARLSSASRGGFVRGQVTGVSAAPLAGIQVLVDGTLKTTGPNGTYMAAVTTGAVTVTANPNNADPAYMQALELPTVLSGQIVTQDFVLRRGGVIEGYVRAGVTPLPDILVTADIAGIQHGAASTNSSGQFSIRNLSSGTYLVSPLLEAGQAASPSSATVTLASVSPVSAGTFTVTGAFGAIAGGVTCGGRPVVSGALIIVSTAAISVPPVAVYGSSATALTPVYSVSSRPDGTYSLPVRAGANYRLLVSMPAVAADGSVSIVTKTYAGITVSPSATTTRDLSLP